MRILNTTLSRHAIAKRLLASGRWRSIGQSGSTGTDVLVLQNSRRVLKLGDEPGLYGFATFLQTHSALSCFPKVYAIVNGNPSTGVAWVGLWCELLNALTPQQSTDWSNWIQQDWVANKGAPTTDPFGASSGLQSLRHYAVANKIGLDVLKPDNVMSRLGTNDLVISDPLY